MRTTSYRYPNEQLVLAGTFLLVLVVIALSATATVCASVIFILGFVIFSYQASLSHHRQLLGAAHRVSAQQAPGLAAVVRRGEERLQPGPVEVYLLPNRQMNAYTFGLGSPKVIVVYSELLQMMDPDELLFIVGHEMGHVALGHTWLNSLIGGMAGIPSPYSAAALMTMAFLLWNRSCEYSADRAGLLACGKPEKAVSALVKLAAGPQAKDPGALRRAFERIDAEDDTLWGDLSEALATHPPLIKRIEQLRSYAASTQYSRIKAQLEGMEGRVPGFG